ncbi:hypothetical protein EI427_10045 [Flammeovirga pectinis]|uniref:Uncharacterized protein n=1 Tax=Flammeovirga pectinis TaxID=2494373 RepID=A0A3S9P2Z2_9BACT|nr:hypothetical protein [Flammeovirga pectinis]AZQ62563.1 hypothetical protein EI427_10045 [Flammeovirga pectinis]
MLNEVTTAAVNVGQGLKMIDKLGTATPTGLIDKLIQPMVSNQFSMHLYQNFGYYKLGLSFGAKSYNIGSHIQALFSPKSTIEAKDIIIDPIPVD